MPETPDRQTNPLEVPPTGPVPATFHPYTGMKGWEDLAYIEVAIPDGWQVYGISYMNAQKTILDVHRA